MFSTYNNAFNSGLETDLGYNGFPVSLNYFTTPDASILTDATATVLFKSLMKNSEITKEKSLNDLATFLEDTSKIDESLVIVWIQLYPKLAIDNSKAVRSLSHKIQCIILKGFGGKQLAKYLKSCIPIWLSGTVDTDKIVRKEALQSLYTAFESEDRVNSKLWVLFQEQIIRFVINVNNEETHESLSDARYTKTDDSIDKYDRVVNGTLQMVCKLIELSNSGETIQWDKIETLFISDKIWDEALPRSLKTNNMGFLKTILLLIKMIFKQQSKNLRESINANKIFKIIGKKFMKHVKLKESPMYFSIVVQLWDTLISLTGYSGKFWSFSDKSRSRLISYLKLGPLNSNPVYYLLLGNFFNVLKIADTDIINFQDPQESQEIYKIITDKATKLTPAFQESYIDCIIQLSKCFDDKESFKNAIYKIFDNSSTQINKKLVKELGSEFSTVFADFEESLASVSVDPEQKLENFDTEEIKLAEKFLQICKQAESDLVYKLLDDIFVNLQETSSTTPKTAFYILTKFLLDLFDSSVVECSTQQEKYVEFAQELGSWIEPDFVEEPLKLVQAILNKIQEEDLQDAWDDVYAKLEMVAPSRLPGFILSIHQSSYELSSDMKKYVESLSQKSQLTSEESKLVISLSNNDDAVHNALQSDNSNSCEFIEVVLQENRDISEAQCKTLLEYCWKNPNKPASKKFVSRVDKEIVKRSIFEFITDNDEFSNDLTEKFDDSCLPVEEIENLLSSLNFDKGLISMGNPLEYNALLASSDVSEVCAETVEKLGRIGKFLLALNTDNSIYYGGLIGEYLSDALFLNIGGDVTLQNQLLDKFLSKIVISPSEAIEYIEGKKDDRLICKVVKNEFYHCRLLKRILTKSSETEIESFGTGVTKLPPLIMSSLLLSYSEHLNSPKFERIRNYIASEIMGVRSDSKILTDGLTWLTLAINLTRTETKYEIFPVHRLLMVLNIVEKWLESDVAYESEFIVIRVQLVQFLRGLIETLPSPPEKVFELANQLCHENLQTCLIDNSLNLRYYSLKLLLILKKQVDFERNEFDEEVLEIMLNEDTRRYDESLNHNPIALVNELYLRYFDLEISTRLLEVKRNDLYKLLESKFVTVQRVASILLYRLIIESQKDFVIEYQLSKSKLADESESSLKADIPAELLRLTDKHFDDFIEYEDQASVTRYIWAWALIFDHFEGITYSIRASYTSQVDVESLLNFIFQQVDVSDPRVLTELKEVDLINFNPTGFDFITEVQMSLIRLYYKTLEYFASQSQTWFNSIRDKQLKNKVEKFTSKYISPLLVNQIFEDMTQRKAPDENMVLKVNRISNEIKSVYTIDEQTMEMVVKIPPNYPLAKVNVEGPLRLGVKETQWRAWLLASQRVISLTNGSIMEAIELFNKNVNLHFSGFEDCAICYSILHQDHSLPSKNCSTCNNKFHAACLYKWFKSSSSSTCPLCRSTFNFSKR